MKIRFCSPGLLAVAALLTACSGLFAEDTDSRIVFLRLRVKDGQISVIDTKIRPGTLKAPRIETPGQNKLHFEMLGADGTKLAHNFADDPSMQRVEYFDSETKRFKTIWKKLDDAEFTIRLPWKADLKSVQFYKLSAEKAADQNAPQALARKNLNAVDITLPATEAK